ncbi:MAG: oligosaccharide flippase family protein [Oscillospiraceae bacterium]|nr:oligosaccharide flippase family protein [Oscillospiraceae bacterium]MBQ6802180.1 oligosaccharide flippase family protein [Oscillospiraceae bacterium]
MGAKKQNFLQGALILSIAAIIVKVIGAVYKIPLMNIIGGEGFGYYNTAYTIFTPLYTIATAGIPVAVARMVSECVTLGRYRDVRRIFQISMTCFLITGTAGSLIMLFGSKFLAGTVCGNPGAFLSVIVLSPAVFFLCMTSAYRGYYQGLRNMYPTAVSQVIEAVVKVAVGLALTVLVTNLGISEYAETGKFLGMDLGLSAEGLSEESAIAPIAAAAAIAGVMISTMVGMLYMMISYRFKGDGISQPELYDAPEATSRKKLLKTLVIIAVPVCLATLSTNITNLIDLVSLMNRMEYALRLDHFTVLEMYEGLLPEGLELEGIPNYLYGVYSGMPVTLFNLVPAIAMTFGTAALPNVASAWTTHNRHRIKNSIDTVLRLTTLIAIPAGIGLSVMSEEVLALLYPMRMNEVAIAAPLLKVMGITVIFVCTCASCHSILQGIGKERLPLIFMLIGAAVKLVVNYIFVAIPSLNIQAAPYGSLICYIIIMIMDIAAINHFGQIRINLYSTFIVPLFSGVLCGIGAKFSYFVFDILFSERLATVGAIGIAVVIYGISILLTKGITKKDFLMIPKGEKIAKVLEKIHLLR